MVAQRDQQARTTVVTTESSSGQKKMKTTPEKEGASSKDRPSPNTQVKGAESDKDKENKKKEKKKMIDDRSYGDEAGFENNGGYCEPSSVQKRQRRGAFASLSQSVVSSTRGTSAS